MLLIERMNWVHWCILVLYSTMLASLTITIHAELYEPLFAPLFMKLHRVWGLIVIVISGANFALLGGGFRPVFPPLDKDVMRAGEK